MSGSGVHGRARQLGAHVAQPASGAVQVLRSPVCRCVPQRVCVCLWKRALDYAIALVLTLCARIVGVRCTARRMSMFFRDKHSMLSSSRGAVCSLSRSNILALEADLLRTRYNIQAMSLAVLAQSATPVTQHDDSHTLQDRRYSCRSDAQPVTYTHSLSLSG